MTLADDLSGQGLQMEQTHISWVFLGEREVWKIKKPVNFGFLDYGTLEKRKRACEAEVQLNRRFSPDVYLGVVPVVLDWKGHHILGGEGDPVEWAVHMVRLPDSHRGDMLLEAGCLSLLQLRRLAERLAAFHAAWPGNDTTKQFGSPEAVGRNMEENFNQSRSYIAGILGPEEARELESGLGHWMYRLEPMFLERMRTGRVRDGHGDLRLSQIYFDDRDRPDILDCIEFNKRFRYGDVCSDIAFLSMDLACRGRTDLAENILAAYAWASGDFDLYAVVDFYQCYRACVRGKVAAILAAEPETPAPARKLSEDKAHRHFLFALSQLRRIPTKPPVIAVGGGIATGKSTLSSRLGELLAAPVLSSDLTRKQMAGLDPLEKKAEGMWQDLYAPAFTEKVYAEVLRRARVVWQSGRPVVIDASFRTRAHRKAIEAAARDAGHSFLFLECRADPELCRDRLRRRDLAPSVSDGRESMFEEFLAAWEPADEMHPAEYAVLDTSCPIEETLAGVLRLLKHWPESAIDAPGPVLPHRGGPK